MGTKKTKKILAWLNTSNESQVSWAVSFLIRENAKTHILRGSTFVQPERNIVYWIQTLQHLHQEALISERATGSTEEPSVSASLKRLDARMRHAWDEKCRRADSHKKAYLFRMDKSIRTKLAVLRTRWKQPIAGVVQILIEDAYESGKRQREVELAPKRAAKRRTRTSLAMLNFRHQQRTANNEIGAHRSLLRELTLNIAELEYRATHSIDGETPLPDSAQIEVSEKADEAAETYLTRIQMDKNLIPESNELGLVDRLEVERVVLGPPPVGSAATSRKQRNKTKKK